MTHEKGVGPEMGVATMGLILLIVLILWLGCSPRHGRTAGLGVITPAATGLLIVVLLVLMLMRTI